MNSVDYPYSYVGVITILSDRTDDDPSYSFPELDYYLLDRLDTIKKIVEEVNDSVRKLCHISSTLTIIGHSLTHPGSSGYENQLEVTIGGDKAIYSPDAEAGRRAFDTILHDILTQLERRYQ